MRRDDGFTLPELLIAIVIAAIIVTVAGAVLIQGLKTNDKTSQRLAESHDAQVAANTFDRDVQSSDTVSKTDTDAVCNLAVNNGALYSLKLSLQWTEASTNNGYTADYLVETRPGQQPALHRRLCIKPSGGSTALQRDVVISDNPLNSSSVVLTCDGSSCPAGPSKPGTVSLQVTETSGYVFALTADRRTTS